MRVLVERSQVFLGDKYLERVYSRREKATGEGGIENVRGKKSKCVMVEFLENGRQGVVGFSKERSSGRGGKAMRLSEETYS